MGHPCLTEHPGDRLWMQKRGLPDIKGTQAGNIPHQRGILTLCVGTRREADVGDVYVPDIAPRRELLQEAGRDRGHDLFFFVPFRFRCRWSSFVIVMVIQIGSSVNTRDGHIRKTAQVLTAVEK